MIRITFLEPFFFTWVNWESFHFSISSTYPPIHFVQITPRPSLWKKPQALVATVCACRDPPYRKTMWRSVSLCLLGCAVADTAAKARKRCCEVAAWGKIFGWWVFWVVKLFFCHQDCYLTINMRPRTNKMKCWASEQRTTNNHQQSTTSGLLSRQVKVQLFAEAGCPFCRAAIAGPVWKPRFPVNASEHPTVWPMGSELPFPTTWYGWC